MAALVQESSLVYESTLVYERVMRAPWVMSGPRFQKHLAQLGQSPGAGFIKILVQ